MLLLTKENNFRTINHLFYLKKIILYAINYKQIQDKGALNITFV